MNEYIFLGIVSETDRSNNCVKSNRCAYSKFYYL